MRSLLTAGAAALLIACGTSDTSTPTPPADSTDTTDDTVVDSVDDTEDSNADSGDVDTSDSALPPEPPPPPASCDAGTEAWVDRVFPLVLGRRAHGAHELKLWAGVADTYGRDVAVRALTAQPEFVEWWSLWLTDTLGVARVGDKAYSACYGVTLAPQHDGTLASFLQSNAALNNDFGAAFTMGDVLRDAVVADDLSVAYRAHLYARMARPVTGANVSDYELEYNRRVNFGETFYDQYLNRNLTCMPCHNSLYSVTDDPDPELDRTWQLPGYFELSLFGSHAGLSPEAAYAMFRHDTVVEGNERPWGMSEDCGTFFAPGELEEDAFGWQPYFIQDLGDGASVWNVELALFEGVQSITTAGLVIDKSGQVDGLQAFAYLVGASIVDAVWEQAVGYGLTIAHDFARNEGQATRLGAYTDAFVTSGYSLRELLVLVATDEAMNPILPDPSCAAADYGLPPLFAPWSTEEEDVARRGNGSGDRVHRLTGRVMMRSLHDALGWDPPPNFSLSGSERDLQAAIGVYLRESQAGFNGSDLQGLLAWEDAYGDCSEPVVGDLECAAPTGNTGCGGCECEACTIGADPYCGYAVWDEICEAVCFDICGGCTDPVVEGEGDVVDLLLEDAAALGLQVGDVLTALRDRLMMDGTLEPTELSLIEAVLEVPASTLVSELSEASLLGLRQVCGAWARSPQWMLAMQADVGEVPVLDVSREADCSAALTALAGQGIKTDCETLLTPPKPAPVP